MKSQNLDDLMEVLACPKCKGELELDSKENKLVCDNCRLKFPILKGNIPDMLLEDAESF
ncbi:MAG: Trm112 family protein [Candidatus Aenigmatarchaeota archaeon]